MASKILIIDDQYGRCGLGRTFQQAVDPDIFSAYRADRHNLCSNYGIFDLTNDSKPIDKDQAQVEAVFSPAQYWDDKTKRIENDLEIAIKAVERGWPFKDGSRWTLVLLDLAFVCGELDCFGDPQERTLFGRDLILPELKKRFGDDLPIVVLSSTPKEENNAAIRRAGALDFIQRIPNSLEQSGTVKEHLADMLFLHGLMPDTRGQVVGRSLPVMKMLRQARRASRYASTILLHGEIGTGKNLLARYIHDVSPRCGQSFEVFNAANRSADLQADELFGHCKGAYTGAVNDAPGLWERCNGGTVLIDEVADLDQSVQQKLMGPIEEKQVSRIGSGGRPESRKVAVDVLTILATNRNLNDLSAEGTIKRDFLSRINATVIDIPPLRDRKEDIPELITSLSQGMKSSVTFLSDALEVLCSKDWKDDNIRGLRRVIEQSGVTHPGQAVSANDVRAMDSGQKDREELPAVPTVGKVDGASLFLSVLNRMPDACSREECRDLTAALNGAFPEVMAHILTWSLQLCGDVTNTARFMTGNPEMDTSASKQFIKKILKLDVKNQAVLKAFMKHPEANDPVLAELVQKESKHE